MVTNMFKSFFHGILVPLYLRTWFRIVSYIFVFGHEFAPKFPKTENISSETEAHKIDTCAVVRSFGDALDGVSVAEGRVWPGDEAATGFSGDDRMGTRGGGGPSFAGVAAFTNISTPFPEVFSPCASFM
jgi:hypothetical protein